MSYTTAVCKTCGIRYSSSAIARHEGSKKCLAQAQMASIKENKWYPLDYRIQRILESPWYAGRVQVVKDLSSVGLVTPKTRLSTKWVPHWFGLYFNEIMKVVRNHTVALAIMHQAIFEHEDTEERIALLDFAVNQVQELYRKPGDR